MPDREIYLNQIDYDWIDWVETKHKPMEQKLRDDMIHKLTLQDTSTYRKEGLETNNKYSHEPQEFRLNLYNIYNSLSDKNLSDLFNLRIKK